MIRFLRRSAGLLLLATVFATGTAAAQRGQFGLEQIDQNANFTRVQLQRLLQQYPPSFGEVLRLDPSLLTNSDYLKPYRLCPVSWISIRKSHGIRHSSWGRRGFLRETFARIRSIGSVKSAGTCWR